MGVLAITPSRRQAATGRAWAVLLDQQEWWLPNVAWHVWSTGRPRPETLATTPGALRVATLAADQRDHLLELCWRSATLVASVAAYDHPEDDAWLFRLLDVDTRLTWFESLPLVRALRTDAATRLVAAPVPVPA